MSSLERIQKFHDKVNLDNFNKPADFIGKVSYLTIKGTFNPSDRPTESYDGSFTIEQWSDTGSKPRRVDLDRSFIEDLEKAIGTTEVYNTSPGSRAEVSVLYVKKEDIGRIWGAAMAIIKAGR